MSDFISEVLNTAETLKIDLNNYGFHLVNNNQIVQHHNDDNTEAPPIEYLEQGLEQEADVPSLSSSVTQPAIDANGDNHDDEVVIIENDNVRKERRKRRKFVLCEEVGCETLHRKGQRSRHMHLWYSHYYNLHHGSSRKGDPKIICSFCNSRIPRSFFDPHLLSKEHVREGNTAEVACRICGQKFIEFDPFWKHLRDHEKDAYPEHNLELEIGDEPFTTPILWRKVSASVDDSFHDLSENEDVHDQPSNTAENSVDGNTHNMGRILLRNVNDLLNIPIEAVADQQGKEAESLSEQAIEQTNVEKNQIEETKSYKCEYDKYGIKCNNHKLNKRCNLTFGKYESKIYHEWFAHYYNVYHKQNVSLRMKKITCSYCGQEILKSFYDVHILLDLNKKHTVEGRRPTVSCNLCKYAKFTEFHSFWLHLINHAKPAYTEIEDVGHPSSSSASNNMTDTKQNGSLDDDNKEEIECDSNNDNVEPEDLQVNEAESLSDQGNKATEKEEQSGEKVNNTKEQKNQMEKITHSVTDNNSNDSKKEERQLSDGGTDVQVVTTVGGSLSKRKRSARFKCIIRSTERCKAKFESLKLKHYHEWEDHYYNIYHTKDVHWKNQLVFCVDCNRNIKQSFFDAHVLINLNQAHGQAEGKSPEVSCNICKEKFTEFYAFWSHLRNHDKPAYPEITDKESVHLYSLTPYGYNLKEKGKKMEKERKRKCGNSNAAFKRIKLDEETVCNSKELLSKCSFVSCLKRFQDNDGRTSHEWYDHYFHVYHKEDQGEVILCVCGSQVKKSFHGAHLLLMKHKDHFIEITCNVCGDIFDSSTNFYEYLHHFRSHAVPVFAELSRELTVDHCLKFLTRKEPEIKITLLKDNPDVPKTFPCNYGGRHCHTRFPDAKSVQYHAWMNHYFKIYHELTQETVTCDVCNDQVKKHLYDAHLLIEHKGTAVCCPLCNIRFKGKVVGIHYYIKHLKRHKKPAYPNAKPRYPPAEYTRKIIMTNQSESSSTVPLFTPALESNSEEPIFGKSLSLLKDKISKQSSQGSFTDDLNSIYNPTPPYSSITAPMPEIRSPITPHHHNASPLATVTLNYPPLQPETPLTNED